MNMSSTNLSLYRYLNFFSNCPRPHNDRAVQRCIILQVSHCISTAIEDMSLSRNLWNIWLQANNIRMGLPIFISPKSPKSDKEQASLLPLTPAAISQRNPSRTQLDNDDWYLQLRIAETRPQMQREQTAQPPRPVNPYPPHYPTEGDLYFPQQQMQFGVLSQSESRQFAQTAAASRIQRGEFEEETRIQRERLRRDDEQVVMSRREMEELEEGLRLRQAEIDRVSGI